MSEAFAEILEWEPNVLWTLVLWAVAALGTANWYKPATSEEREAALQAWRHGTGRLDASYLQFLGSGKAPSPLPMWQVQLFFAALAGMSIWKNLT